MIEILQAVGIFSILVSALVGFFFWLIQRNINKRDAADQRRSQTSGTGHGYQQSDRPAAGAGSERAGAVSA